MSLNESLFYTLDGRDEDDDDDVAVGSSSNNNNSNNNNNNKDTALRTKLRIVQRRQTITQKVSAATARKR